MDKNLVNLNVNPCKMCMPMGAVSALYGIRKCMSILHGSQGCSTYIRRHMATHYNEPVDIASSSLTEEGTVYGGEENLIKGLKNLIHLYQPEVIGVATTCLAETIGEDVPRIIDKFYEQNPEYKDIPIISVPSPGYSGTQYEGFFKALYQVVKTVPMLEGKNQKVNMITGLLSPADTRYLKKVLDSYGIDYILLPDLSENLDGGYRAEYERLPSKGTSIKDIGLMGGARYTLELSTFTTRENSPAEYLYENYGVPYKKLNLPMSLRDNDAFMKELRRLSDCEFPKEMIEERKRYLDAMVDSHKYNSGKKAVIFGEPDFIFGAVRLCVENGVIPLVVATGSKCPTLKELLYDEVKEIADSYYEDKFEILEDVDFQIIEDYARKLNADLLIGNSDARRIEEKLGITLVRRGFPIHDRIGGQRLLTLGYRGSLTLLDDITNAFLAKTESSFRKELYQRYFKENSIALKKEGTVMIKEENNLHETIEEKTKKHPCFNCGAHEYARMHLPVAPKCNISCNYCLRKFDCPNESRPGVTTKVLTPEEAYSRYLEVDKRVPNLSVIGIAGPGDALANFEDTKKTIELIKEHNPDIIFCLSTNGLLLPMYADELIKLGVSHVTVTMNTINPKIGGQIYKYVDYMGIKYSGEQGAAILMANQLTGIKMLTDKGIICKVNIVMLKGINDEHIEEVVKKVKELGGTITNIMQLIPVKGSVFENLPLVSNKEVMEMRKKCKETMKQMYHCKQCRADAIGTLDHDCSIEFSSGRGSLDSGEKTVEDMEVIAKEIVKQNETEKQKDISKKDNIHSQDKIENQGCEADLYEKQLSKEDSAKKSSIKELSSGKLDETLKTLKFAAATKSGMIIDQHFGQVSELYIYEYKNNTAIFKEKRNINKYCSGNEACDDSEDKIAKIINTISDCDGIIAMRIGDSPTSKLENQGINVFTTYDRIEEAVKMAAAKIFS